MTIFNVTLSDGLKVKESVDRALWVVLSETLNVASALTRKFNPGAELTDTLRIGESISVHTIYDARLVEHLKIFGDFRRIVAEHLIEHAEFADTSKVAFSLMILDRLFLHDIPGPRFQYHQALVEAISYSSILQKFLGGFLSDEVDFESTLIPQWVSFRTLDDEILFSDLMAPSLLVRMDLQDDMEFSDSEALQMIFNGQLSDTLVMRGAYLAPSGSFTTWAINTRTNSVTEYDNYVFNSFAKKGHHFYGANDEGLWRLDGELDDTIPVPTLLAGGYMQLGGSRFTAFKTIYLGMRVRSDVKDFFLKLVAGDGREYVYQVQPNHSMMTTRIFVGKGLRSRYFRWELSTPGGEDFDLDSIEFVPITSKRRI